MKITILGGDKKSILVMEALKTKGLDVCLCGFDQIENAENININIETALQISDYIILPLPATRDGETIEAPFSKNKLTFSMLESFKNKAHILGGFTNGETDFTNYYDKPLQIINGIPSAEGAIMEAIRNTDYTLCGSNCLVLGYGSISRILCRLLRSFGANVTVTARKKTDITYAKSEHLNAINTASFTNHICEMDIIFNTVPYLLLTESILKKCKNSALIIDLATKAGTDFIAAKELGRNAIHATSMPSKTAPITASRLIADRIIEIIEGDI